MNVRTGLLIFVMVLVVAMIAACETVKDDQPPMEVEARTQAVTVNWVSINSPPGVEGPCYAFFFTETGYHLGYGYSGVYCSP